MSIDRRKVEQLLAAHDEGAWQGDPVGQANVLLVEAAKSTAETTARMATSAVEVVGSAASAVVDLAAEAVESGRGHAKKAMLIGVTGATVLGGASEIGVSPAAAAPAPVSAPAPANLPVSTTHITIKRGYTDWWLAEKGSQVSGKSIVTELQETKTENPGDNPNDLQIGSQETVPVEIAQAVQPIAPAPHPAPAPGNTANVSPEPAPASAPTTAKVPLKAGQSWWWLAEQGAQVSHDSVSSELQKIEGLNAGENPNRLPVGSLQTVPIEVYQALYPAPAPATASVAAPAPANTSIGTVIIKPHDSYWKLGAEANSIVGGDTANIASELQADTGVSAGDLIPGHSVTGPAADIQAIKTAEAQTSAPAPAPEATPAPKPPITNPISTVVVNPGDTMWSIAQKAGNPNLVGQIKAANPGVDPTDIQPGQTLNVPAVVAQAEAAPAPAPIPVAAPAPAATPITAPAAPYIAPAPSANSEVSPTSPEIPKMLWDYGTGEAGLTSQATAGILGSIVGAESGGQPERLEGTAAGVVTPYESLTPQQENDPSLGWGLAQWTPSIKVINGVKQAGGNPDNPIDQFKFLISELKGTSTWDKLMAARTPENAAWVFAYYFERPSAAALESSLPSREQSARNFYNQFALTAPQAPTSTTPAPAPEAPTTTTTTAPAPTTTITVAPAPTTTTTEAAPTTTTTTAPAPAPAVAPEVVAPAPAPTDSQKVLAKILTDAYTNGSHGSPYNGGGAGTASYQADLKELDENSPGFREVTDGADCDNFVSTVMRSSGVDPGFPAVGTWHAQAWMNEHPDKYQQIPNAGKNTQFDPSSTYIMVVNKDGGYGANGHIWFKIPQQADGADAAGASGDSLEPFLEHSGDYLNSTGTSFNDGRGPYTIYKVL